MCFAVIIPLPLLVCHEYHRQYGGCGGNRRGVVLWVLERSGEAAVVPFYEKLSLCCGAQSVFQYCEHLEVRNKYREFVLSRKGRTQDSSPQEEIEYQELRHLIDTTLARMPERRLRIFRMHRMEGKKYVEIASQLFVGEDCRG